ncbi:uncharacterized protein Z520_04811 [Fonsecaea multimorphosa CBS 102226]|uniref:Uncharacterized protein n=1 Tax=Fonsecaea multimorphosa CBS 102226 TaxID=1442371 RepID=A0A0D2HBF9_9EURO|nr:uncharacterized protein Z520_04811 [Fonsecaea multimorphosa CBS 102226]KIX99235.1 hypothetical protein Z520_04811 [Fonsecaea multimorphosa CBS 102226]
MFPQIKRSAANLNNNIKNRIPAKVSLDGQNCQSTKVTPDGSRHRTDRRIQKRGCESRNVLSSGPAFGSSTDLEVCRPNITQPTQRSKDNSDPPKQHPLHHVNIATPKCRSRRGDASKSTTVSNVISSKTERASLPSKRNLSAFVQSSTLQQGKLDAIGDAPGKLHSTEPNKKPSSKKENLPKKAKCPGQRPRMTETTLTSSDICALNAKVETSQKNIDKVVEELRHSSQTFASSVKTPHKNKRSHATAFTECNGSITHGRSKKTRNNTPHELAKRTTSGALKSPIPRAPDVTIFPRLAYIMRCDENGVPAGRAPFRRPTPVTHTIRDQVGNPLPRTEKPLAEILKYDQERRRRDPMVRTNYWSRFPKPSPPRNGRWICHKQLSSAKMPLRGSWPRRPQM